MAITSGHRMADSFTWACKDNRAPFLTQSLLFKSQVLLEILIPQVRIELKVGVDPTPSAIIELKVYADPTSFAMDLSEVNVDPPPSVMESNEIIEQKVDADPTLSTMDLSENKNVDPPPSVMEIERDVGADLPPSVIESSKKLTIEQKVNVDPTPSAMDLSEIKVNPPPYLMKSNEIVNDSFLWVSSACIHLSTLALQATEVIHHVCLESCDLNEILFSLRASLHDAPTRWTLKK
ncbi:hypothetical protein F3Y22_tig00000991pilonHSYRG00176 [Hibiscus syriacus]|uniref:Uncharacterized protein n=1 Tax=Hibiscus syriacus TaxID=106335 RepID=A0A6A3CXE2_HIBSY|nr:hypothetical protein F3Y22_tig00000991pilonHSYRG00176 [Hibiscus syriacus]